VAGCTVAANGTLLISASGNSVLEYSLDGTTWQSDSLFSNLASGEYTIFVRDEGGCETSENASIGTKDDPLITDFEIVEAGCTVANGSLIVSATGNSVLEYSLDGISWQSDSLFSNLASGDYTILVRDEGGCETSENVTIETTEDPI